MMKKTPIRWIGIAIAVLLLVGGTAFVMIQKAHAPIVQESKDEFTGVWHGEGTTKDGYSWFVEYTFKNGTYDMKTESTFKDNGTYEIVKRFEDNVSVQMRKTSIPFNKTYDIYISIVDPNTISIDGMKLYRK